MRLLYTSLALCAFLLPLLLPAKTIDVYIGTGKDGGVLHATLDSATGTLSPTTQVAELTGAGFIVAHPNQQNLYSIASTPGRRIGSVASFKINPDKSLSLINTQSSEGANVCHISMDTTGRTVLVANYNSNQSVASFPVQDDGSLAKAASTQNHSGSGEHPKRQTKPHPHSIYPNPANTFAYAADLGTDQVYIYKLDPVSATLESAGEATVPGGAKGPRHMKFSADGQFLYVLNELSLDVSTFRADPKTGALSYLDCVDALPADMDRSRISGSEIRIHPSGQFLYTANRDLSRKGRDAISVFARDSKTGQLKWRETVNPDVSIPRNFNISPDGQWMLACGQASGNIAVLKIDPSTGSLTPHQAPIATGASPICIEFIPKR